MTHRTKARTAPRDEGAHRETRRPDGAAAARRDRFGALPERIRPQDMVETRPATAPDPARDAYNPDEWLIRYCG